MDNTIIIITFIVIAGMAIFLPIVYSKVGINNIQIFEILKNTLSILGNINKNLDYQYKDVMQLIIDYSKLAVSYAEQLYNNGTITADERKTTAIKYMEESLALQGIELDNRIRTLIDATIEAAVFVLPPSIEYDGEEMEDDR